MDLRGMLVPRPYSRADLGLTKETRADSGFCTSPQASSRVSSTRLASCHSSASGPALRPGHESDEQSSRTQVGEQLLWTVDPHPRSRKGLGGRLSKADRVGVWNAKSPRGPCGRLSEGLQPTRRRSTAAPLTTINDTPFGMPKAGNHQGYGCRRDALDLFDESNRRLVQLLEPPSVLVLLRDVVGER